MFYLTLQSFSVTWMWLQHVLCPRGHPLVSLCSLTGRVLTCPLVQVTPSHVSAEPFSFSLVLFALIPLEVNTRVQLETWVDTHRRSWEMSHEMSSDRRTCPPWNSETQDVCCSAGMCLLCYLRPVGLIQNSNAPSGKHFLCHCFLLSWCTWEAGCWQDFLCFFTLTSVKGYKRICIYCKHAEWTFNAERLLLNAAEEAERV